MALDQTRQRQHKLRNTLHSMLLLGGMALLLALITNALQGPGGILWILVGSLFGLAIMPRIAPELIMRAYGARELSPRTFPAGCMMVQELARRAGLPRTPRLFYLPVPVPNAFAVGQQDDAAIAVSHGLLQRLNERELAGVLAHEVSHVRNNDLLIMGLADMISRLASLMSYLGIFLLGLNLPVLAGGAARIPWLTVVLLIFAPTISGLMQLALARSREYDADLGAAALTGDPAGLASALAKLEQERNGYWERILLPGRRIPEPSVLRTHPPSKERIRRLLELRPEQQPSWREGLPGLSHRAILLPPGMVVTPRWRRPGYWL